MSCLDCHDLMDGYNRGKREGTIEELTKIKTEIEDISNDERNIFCVGSVTYIHKGLTLKAIDKRLLELKGETE